jgi:hypothetical protein
MQEPIPIGQRRATKRKLKLSAKTHLEIAHRAIVGKESQQDLALEYRTSTSNISMIVNKLRRNPDSLNA